MVDDDNSHFTLRISLQVLTKSSSASIGIFGLEKGVYVALPPGNGDILPMDCDTSQNFTSVSSPDVSSCVGYSVELTGMTILLLLLLEECDEAVDIICHPQSSQDAVLIHPPCFIDDVTMTSSFLSSFNCCCCCCCCCRRRLVVLLRSCC